MGCMCCEGQAVRYAAYDDRKYKKYLADIHKNILADVFMMVVKMANPHQTILSQVYFQPNDK